MNASSLSLVLSGAIMLGTAAIGLIFWRFWSRTRDRLFVLFACAFWALAAERVLLLVVGAQNEFRPSVYLVRLIAFSLIFAAVVDKNRRR
jgi:hypothetical protein